MEIVWAILLWILKALGYLIGGLLLLVLILLLIILIVPIRYQIDLTKKDAFLYGGKVKYFIKVLYHHTDTENVFEIKFLGFTIKKTVTPVENQDSNKDLSDVERDLWETDWQNIEEEEFKRKLFKYLEDEKKAMLDEKIQTEQAKRFASDGIIYQDDKNNESNDIDVSQHQTIGEWIEQNNQTLNINDMKESNSSKQDENGSILDTQLENSLEQDVTYKVNSEEINQLNKENDQSKKSQNIYKEWDDDWFDSTEANDNENSSLSDQLLNKIESNKQKYEEIKAKIDRIWKLFEEVRTYFSKNKGVIRHIFHWLFRILKSILPKRMDGHLNFGLNDPANTGYVLAIFYLFYPENRGKIKIDADFEKFVFSGEVQIKGRVILMVLLYYALRIVIDIRIIRLIKLIFKIKKDFTTSNNANDENNNKNNLDESTYASAEV